MPDCELILIAKLPGDAEGETYRLDRPAVAGRSEDCDVRLRHPLVSRRHAEFSCSAAGEVVVRDLGSTNGTLVGDDVLRSASVTLEGHVPVQIGPYAIAVAIAGAADDATVLAPVRAASSHAPPAPAPGTARGDPLPDRLTAREVEVIRLVTRGRTNPEIAEELVLSVNTVTRHVSNIFDKTSAANRVELVRYAFERGLAD